MNTTMTKKTTNALGLSMGMLLTIGLTACGVLQQTSQAHTTDVQISKDPAQAVVLPLNDAKLQHHVWQLNSVTDSKGSPILPELSNHPQGALQLKFTADKQLQFLNTCNQMSAAYILTNHDIEISPIISTRMACDEQGSAFDVAATKVVQGQFKLTLNQLKQPILTVYGDGLTAIFYPVSH